MVRPKFPLRHSLCELLIWWQGKKCSGSFHVHFLGQQIWQDAASVLFTFITPAHCTIVWQTACILILYCFLLGYTKATSSRDDTTESAVVNKTDWWVSTEKTFISRLLLFIPQTSFERAEGKDELLFNLDMFCPFMWSSQDRMLTNNTLQLHLRTHCNAVRVKLQLPGSDCVLVFQKEKTREKVHFRENWVVQVLT